MIHSALVIHEAPLALILSGAKRWEMRTIACHKREFVGLIQQGSGKIMGTARIIACHGPLTDAQLSQTRPEHQTDPKLLSERNWRYAWELADVQRLAEPLPYTHSAGAQQWVTLNAVDVSRLDARRDKRGKSIRQILDDN